MYLRWVSASSRGRKQRYAQLVEGYRVPGKRHPRVRVLLGLGAISQLQYDNLTAALRASRCADTVVPRKALPDARADELKPTANLRFADIAVLLDIARQHGLIDILREALRDAHSLTLPLTLALVLQRCVEPASKLEAVRWIPKTALPELLALPLASVNNTRIHRVLSELAQADDGIQARLARRLHESDRGFAALFIDTTDTWFVGRGPDLAKKGKTKEGLLRRKITIVMMCNEHGLPVRWSLRSGSDADCVCMQTMLKNVAKLPWLRDTPVVCDRAMGKPAVLCELSQLRIRFVTALPKSDAAHLGIDVPKLDLQLDDSQAVESVLRDGFTKLSNTLFIKDLGTRKLKVQPDSSTHPPDALDEVATTLKLTQQLIDGVRNGQFPSQAAAAASAGIDKHLLSKNKPMLDLPTSVKQDILDGRYPGLTLATARRLGKNKDTSQLDAELKAATTHRVRPGPREQPDRQQAGCYSTDNESTSSSSDDDNTNNSTDDDNTKVRIVLYFNPELFQLKRRNAQCAVDDIQQFVARLNSNQATGRSKHDEKKLFAATQAKLKKYNLITAFSSEVSEAKDAGRRYHKIELKLKDDEWHKRRKYDGFTVLAVHPKLAHDPEQLARLYRAKDKIEKDFQVIKSVTCLRPVHHYTDVKVEAHVTLCVLALLVERLLQRKLAEAKINMTAQAALGELASCMLNLFKRDRSIYTVTEPSREQRNVLRALRLENLVDDAVMADRINPR